MATVFPADAPVPADLVAVVEIALAAMLVVGAILVHSGRVRAHRYVQSAVILLNIPIVLSWMVPQYLAYVAPGLPHHLAQPDIFVPTIMLVAGVVAELLGVYILLVAGTAWIPERFRFRRYKLWMRTELGLWWCVVGAGLATYVLFYAPGATS
ncbi:MAG: hypothetical protein WCA77_04745 [Thermoplasmata archaeon]